MKKTGKFFKCASKPAKGTEDFEPQELEDPDDSNWDFFAFVPDQIRADDKYEPLLVGLPLNIL